MKTTWWMRMPLAIVITLAVAACASIGRPQGGPKDTTPPEYVKSTPAPGTTNFRRQQIDITFDENIKVEDVMNKVVVSPAQITQPSIIANGRHIYITLKDTLLDDATYTIDFSDAVRDLNEGNILDGFAIDFATGDSIDSLRISGIVLEAATLEPAQGIIVGAYRNLADSAISTLRFERITKTNQSGQFTLRNLKKEPYRLFALNDINRDYHWDRSEDIAFYNAPVTPWVETIEVTDTFVAADGTDSIVSRLGSSYYPNDILLTWFNENYKAQYLRDYSRPERNKILIGFAAPSDTFPILTITNGPNAGRTINEAARLQYTIDRDTLSFWIQDSAIISQDSLLIATTYLRTDSTDNLTWTTDTLKFIYKLSQAQKREIEKAAKAKAEKEKRRRELIEKAIQSGDSTLLADTMPEKDKPVFLEIKAISGQQQDYNQPLRIQVSQPLASFRSDAISLQWLEDSTWIPLDETIELKPDTAGNIMDFTLDVKWDYATKYKFHIDSAAMTGIYGIVNNNFTHEFEVKSSDEYSTLIFNIPNAPYAPEPPYDWLPSSDITSDTLPADTLPADTLPADTIEPRIIVQLLSSSDAPVATATVIDGKARFDFITPATYFARAFIDFNGNGIWDTGRLLRWQQPEDVYYYPKKITVKKNWDMEQTWDLFETPLDTQKPLDILKNKPKTSEGKTTSTDDDEEENFGSNNFIYGQGADTYGNGAKYNNARRNQR